MSATARQLVNETRTHRQGTWTTQLGLKSTRECSWHAGLVWVVASNNAHQAEHGRDKGSKQQKSETGLVVGVGLRREDAQDVIVLVDGLAVVAALLLVPPVLVWVTQLALDWRWLWVAAVLCYGLTRPPRLNATTIPIG